MIESLEEIQPVPAPVKKCSTCDFAGPESMFRPGRGQCRGCWKKKSRAWALGYWKGAGKEIKSRWRNSPSVKARIAEYESSERRKRQREEYVKAGKEAAAQKRFRQKPGQKEKMAAYDSQPHRREMRATYSRSERGREKMRNWMKTPEGKASFQNSRSKRRAAIASGNVSFREIATLLKKAAKCPYCGDGFVRAVKSIDHIMPLSRGGTHSLENLIVCCRTCNGRKSAMLPEEWALRIGIAHAPKGDNLNP